MPRGGSKVACRAPVATSQEAGWCSHPGGCAHLRPPAAAVTGASARLPQLHLYGAEEYTLAGRSEECPACSSSTAVGVRRVLRRGASNASRALSLAPARARAGRLAGRAARGVHPTGKRRVSNGPTEAVNAPSRRSRRSVTAYATTTTTARGSCSPSALTGAPSLGRLRLPPRSEPLTSVGGVGPERDRHPADHQVKIQAGALRT